MSAGRYDIYAERGARWRKQLLVRYRGGLPIDLTVYDPQMHIRPVSGGPLTFELDLEDNFVTTDMVNGRLIVLLTPANTSSIAAGRYKYDLKLVNSGDATDEIRLLEGTFTISGEITT